MRLVNRIATLLICLSLGKSSTMLSNHRFCQYKRQQCSDAQICKNNLNRRGVREYDQCDFPCAIRNHGVADDVEGSDGRPSDSTLR